MSVTRLGSQTRQLIDAARHELRGDPASVEELRHCGARLEEPLRVALTGTLKAGKSTLLNALVGEEIAPTDATECTRVVTWFEQSATPRIDLTHDSGRRTRLPVHRDGGRLSLDLGTVTADRVERLQVGWPSALLGEFTLVDTPGTSSNSRDVSARTRALLLPEDGPCDVDAVVYLTRGTDGADVRLLDQLQTRVGTAAGPLGIVGVLSRADEVRGGRERTLDAARAAADEAGRRVQRSLLPVSGLLALRGRTLRQTEFDDLAVLATVPDGVLESALRSITRFTAEDTDLVLSPGQRRDLLESFGLFGVRFAVRLIRAGATDAPALARELTTHSGLEDLRRTLHLQFGQRSTELKAHSALRTLKAVLARTPSSASRSLSRAADRLLADTHVFRELRVLSGLRASGLQLPDSDVVLLERVLGGEGMSPHTRLGMPADAAPEQISRVALTALRFWRSQAGRPTIDTATVQACACAARSCEALLAR
ncbi:dynamin family protein [Rhodococcus sp. NPDC057529]|uniref:dynamin family protein n=1 Tax=Rhodococcus sp. NPDC057529 TaxID=3346158 RepID=UPI00366F5DB9